MSMENAILEHASALREVAAAVRALVDATMGSVIAGTVKAATGLDPLDVKAADLAGATKERASKARDAEAKDAQQNAAAKENTSAIKLDDDLAASVAEVEKANAKASTTDDDGLDTPLDYAKDVRPVLLAAIKKAGKDKVQELINGFGVDKADKVDPAKFGKLLAGAQLLAA